MSGLVFVDGEQVAWPGPARIDDPNARPGLGLFETMRARRGAVPLLSRHLARLTASASALGLPCRSAAAIRHLVGAAISGVGTGEHRVRLVLNETGQIVVDVNPFEAGTTQVRLTTVLGPVQVEGFAEHKTTAYLPYIRAREHAVASGAHHALLVRADGAVLEADHGSVVALIGGDLVTPHAADILPGIARTLLIQRLGITQERLAVGDIIDAGAVYVVNALRGVAIVVDLDGESLRQSATELERIERGLPELHTAM